MNACRLALASCTLAAGAAALPALAQSYAGTDPAPNATLTSRRFLVTTTSQSPQGDAVIHEALAFEREGNRYRLFLANADGTTFSSPVDFGPGGIIATNSQDGAVTCYNMAMNALAGDREPATNSAAVFVMFGNSVVRVPLVEKSAKTSGTARSIVLSGASKGELTDSTGTSVDAGILINATIDEQNGTLRSARFEEDHYVGSDSQVAGRSICTVRQSGTDRAGASRQV